jgi:hypothetical protein
VFPDRLCISPCCFWSRGCKKPTAKAELRFDSLINSTWLWASTLAVDLSKQSMYFLLQMPTKKHQKVYSCLGIKYLSRSTAKVESARSNGNSTLAAGLDYLGTYQNSLLLPVPRYYSIEYLSSRR